MRMRLAWQLAHFRLRLAHWSLMWPVNNERHRSKCRRICRKQPDLAPHQTPRYACLLVEDQWRQDITCSHDKNRDRQRRHRTSAPSDSVVLVNYGSVFTYLLTYLPHPAFMLWRQQNHWPHFVASSRHICSGSLSLTTCWTSTDCLRWT